MLFQVTLVCLLILTIGIESSSADNIVINGDSWILEGTKSRYDIIVNKNYPFQNTFNYIFDLNLPKPVHEEIFSQQTATWTHDFTNVTRGSYELHIQIYIYYMNIRLWLVGERRLQLEVRDTLDDFIVVTGHQDGLPSYTPDSIYRVDKPVNLTTTLRENSILKLPTTKIDYLWTVNGASMNNTKFNTSSFENIFNSSGEYIIDLVVNAKIGANLLKSGSTRSKISIKKPLSDVSVKGLTNIQKGNFLKLDLSCEGSANFVICHQFTSQVTNDSCFDDARTLANCTYNIKHYFFTSGPRFLNIGLRNDISDEVKNIKIVVYPFEPKTPIAFVIIPLVSVILVILIIVLGIVYYIRQRRSLNATIEEATFENFGIRDDDDEQHYVEKTFVGRVRDSLQELMQR